MVGKAEAESGVTAASGGARAATGALSHGCRHLHTRVCGHASTMTAPGGGAAAAIGAAAVEAVTIGGLAAPIAVAGTAISAHICGHAQHAHEREQTKSMAAVLTRPNKPTGSELHTYKTLSV